MATKIFIPDAGNVNPEETTVDGYTARSTSGTFSAIHSGIGNQANDVLNTLALNIGSTLVTDEFQNLRRAIFLFDLDKALLANGSRGGGRWNGGAIHDISLTLGDVFSSTVGLGNPDIIIVQSNPASNTALGGTDFNIANFGTEIFASIAFADVSGDVPYSLTQAGIDYVKSIMSKNSNRIVKLGAMLSWDFYNNFTGVWASNTSSGWNFSSAESGFFGDFTRLTITYTPQTIRKTLRPAVFMPGIGR